MSEPTIHVDPGDLRAGAARLSRCIDVLDQVDCRLACMSAPHATPQAGSTSPTVILASLYAALTASLAPGETLLWWGQPDPKRIVTRRGRRLQPLGRPENWPRNDRAAPGILLSAVTRSHRGGSGSTPDSL
jgi:hypothetical protein